MATKQTIIPGLDDDTVIAWWELYDSGLTLDQVAAEVEIHVGIVHIALGPEGLNVLDNARLSPEHINGNTFTVHLGLDLSEDFVQQARLGLLSPADQAMYEAIGKLGMAREDGVGSHRHLPFAAALPHQVPQNLGKHSYHPMTKRQRRMDKEASMKWRKLCARDMRRSGIL